MPKEVVHHGDRYATITVQGDENHSGWTYEVDVTSAQQKLRADEVKSEDVIFARSPELSVHWSRAGEYGDTEMGQDPAGAVQVMLMVGDFEMKRIVDNFENEAGDRNEETWVFTRKLSRYQINAMIRTLQRARDQAYGRDE